MLIDGLKAVLTTGEFWAALIGLVGTILFIAHPDFPPELWVAITTLLTSVLAALGVNVAKMKVEASRQRRMRDIEG